MKVRLRFRFWAQLLLAALLLLLWNGVLEARIVVLSEVRQVAARLLEMEHLRPDLRLTQDTFRLDGLEPLIHQDQPVAYLAKLKPQGFMILSDITEVSPQVFVSFSSDFDTLREHPFLVSILDRLRYDKILLFYLVPSDNWSGQLKPDDVPDFTQIERNRSAWSLLLSDFYTDVNFMAVMQSAESVTPLLAVYWGQRSPYWNYTPRVSGQQTVTGCSATAMAQVMYFWKYPERGQGSHSYVWDSQTLSANFDHPYRWDRMLSSYSGGYNSEQADAVARLMSDVGISIDMNYGVDGSSAVANRDNALVNFFKYSPDLRWKYRSDVANWEAWFNIFKQQMDIGLPVLLTMYKSTGGHAVVVDGYRTSPSNQVHVNMGWEGSADNYYNMSNIYGYGDDSKDRAIIDIHPIQLRLILQANTGGTTNPAPGTYSYGYGTGINIRITALPDIYYRFLNWSGGASGSQNPLDIILDREISIAANFQRIIYAPINVAGQKVFNRSLSQAEYINIISFEDNPVNVNISSYNVYLVDNEVRTKVGSVGVSHLERKRKNTCTAVLRRTQNIHTILSR